ncbi:MAG: acyltransferase [Acidobacteria bacterium]|nr:acyltransferase [Acidobacteriota bacterium]
MDIESRTATRQYLPFVDWMKCIGIALIVIGHVASAPINHLTPPIFPKQLGVAFFMFVMGFSLARETRRPLQVLLNRLFEIYLFGIAIALLLSVVMYLTKGTLNLSNYLPFLLGVNVLFNNFPANPTTWYIGTYLHVLIVWAVIVRRLRIQPWMLAVSVFLEIAARAVLLATVGKFIAYMLVPNWITVFLLGTWFGQRTHVATGGPDEARSGGWRNGVFGYSLLLAGWAAGWALAVRPLVREFSFPFMRLSSTGRVSDALITSIAASTVYLVYTLLSFHVARRTSAPGWVRFIARNTLIIFIAHMPVYYALGDLLNGLRLSYLQRSIIHVSVCLVGLAFVSEFIRKAVRPVAARQWLAARLGLTSSFANR